MKVDASMMLVRIDQSSQEEEEIEIRVFGRFSPGLRGKTSGLPEDCYPDEDAEAEFERAETLDGKPIELSREEVERAEEVLIQEGQEYDSFDEDYYDDD